MIQSGATNNIKKEMVMITLEDCVDMSGLTDEEILSVEEAEHLPPMEACARGHQLAESPKGCRLMMKYLLDSIERAEGSNDLKHAEELHRDYEQFAARHHYI
jgi:hypothetical protein